MELNWKDSDNLHILKISGHVDSNTTPEMAQAIETRLQEASKDILIDFSDVEYISSAGLRVVIKTHHMQTTAGQKMILCSLKDYVYEIFEMSGLVNLLDIRKDLESVIS